MDFGPFRLHELCCRKEGGRRIGISIICGRHCDIAGELNQCSSDLNFGTRDALSEAEALRRLKRWAIRGFIVDGEPAPRAMHMKAHGPARRRAMPLTEAELACVPAGLFSDADLNDLWH